MLRPPVALALSLVCIPALGAPRAAEERAQPALSLAVVGGTYAAAATYTYFSWYGRSENSDTLTFRDEGFFGYDTYAGGADRLGHAWCNYVLTRGIGGVLGWGGHSKAVSLATSTSLAFGFFLFDRAERRVRAAVWLLLGDLLFNAGGNAFAVGAELLPELDDFMAFRLSYWPSKSFVRQLNAGGALNVAEDYSGQAFLVSYHLSSIQALREGLAWPQFADLTVGYRALHYEPSSASRARTQELFRGLSLNLQQVIDRIHGGAPARAPAGVRAARFATQVLAPPFTTLELASASRRRSD